MQTTVFQSIIDNENLLVSLTPNFVTKEKTLKKSHWLTNFGTIITYKCWTILKILANNLFGSIDDEENLLVLLTPGFVAKEKTLEKLNWLKNFSILVTHKCWTMLKILQTTVFPKHHWKWKFISVIDSMLNRKGKDTREIELAKNFRHQLWNMRC